MLATVIFTLFGVFGVAGALGATRELRGVMQLLAAVGDSLPPPTAPSASVFVWPSGETRPVVPLESDEELAQHDGYVTSANGAAPDRYHEEDS